MEKALTETCLDSAEEARRLVSCHVEHAIVFAWRTRASAARWATQCLAGEAEVVTKRAFPIIELAALSLIGMCSAALKASAKVSLSVDESALRCFVTSSVLLCVGPVLPTYAADLQRFNHGRRFRSRPVTLPNECWRRE
ncbi:hypothetical protein HPB50_020154 [Hyalomma asiaticum]|uniref:Uncharacterized protein n=1 Tax=Hyalomma asiaticum TaxID=266040 RepID=A0ACB7TMM5_HYAAI|nr:hypothetical protein HPB50_020154 [Hyalomma asiaticum]